TSHDASVTAGETSTSVETPAGEKANVATRFAGPTSLMLRPNAAQSSIDVKKIGERKSHGGVEKNAVSKVAA
ncbi:MAG: hypothetical protein ACKVG4_01250, partial [Longimicrobiales bacterium]